MRKLLLVLTGIFAVSGTNASSREEIAGPVVAAILRVIDGDTLLVEARPWPQQRMEVYVRIRGIDTPELHSGCESARQGGRDAQHALEVMATASPEIALTHISGDKYFGRIVADVTFASGRSAGADLVHAGLARPYDGGGKPIPVCGRE